MYLTPYVYNKMHTCKYTFTSIGKRDIVKVIEFTPTQTKGVYNLGFGDLQPNGEIDDVVSSNNGDIVKIFATVIDILQDFTEQNPSYTILFFGSTSQRTRLYQRILRTYYQAFSKIFIVTGFVETETGTNEVPFDPASSTEYFAFFVKRIM